SGAMAALWHALALGRCKRELDRLGDLAAGLIVTPSLSVLAPSAEEAPCPARDKVRALADAYRQALDSVVQLQEKLDLRASARAARAASDPAPVLGPTHFVVGTSRN